MANKEQDIVSHLITQLELVKTGPPDYHAVLVTVEEGRTTQLDEDELPAAIVRTGKAEKKEIGSGSPYDRVNWLVPIEIEISTVGETDEEARQHIADVYKAIGTDETFGSHALQAMPVSHEIRRTQEERKVIGAIINIEIEYQVAKWQES